ncbi:S1/P1 Nuclease [Chitinophaga pendula]|uniref:zinc dependent phospholipase C family protein n=1 Tax=Chitinophaga TaxID=79328 RepID=UPI0012FE3E36|nr:MULTISPECIES: zinc dependent phospholipase C family protein [Chitinophaga]UCJ06261.1 S1/P1 Nuclease [Chitinophaga pendula]
MHKSSTSWLFCFFLLIPATAKSWGFFAHQRINKLAVFCLPPEMLVFYKANITFIAEHSVDPDKRRYVVPEEAPRHYIDIDRYTTPPYDSLPHSWQDAVSRYTADTLQRHGILPWHLNTMMYRLTKAFEEKDPARILKLSADLGHYVADAHVPLHACSNYNGQFTGQQGIHALWESRIPELLADATFNYWVGKATYLNNTDQANWQTILESATAADSVLTFEKQLSVRFNPAHRYAYEQRNGKLVRNYATEYAKAYHQLLNGMVERRMQQSIHRVASCWYTAWVNAGQPSLYKMTKVRFSEEDQQAFKQLDLQWKIGDNNSGQHE